MPCLILFRDASGWLPTAQEMRRCGFCVSAAALPTPVAVAMETMTERGEEMREGLREEDGGLALAAEPVSEYGAKSPAQAAGEPGAGQPAEAGLS